MESLSRAVGSPLPLWVAGQLRLVKPLTLSMFGSIEMYLLNARELQQDIVLRFIDTLDAPALELLQFAIDADNKRLHYLPTEELDDFMSSVDGVTLCLWLMTRDTEPTWDYEAIYDHLRMSDEEEQFRLTRAIASVSGLDKQAEQDWKVVGGTGGEETKRRMNWKHLVRKMCEAYLGMTPELIGNMTLYNLRALTAEEGNVKGMKMTVYEFRAAQARGELEDADIKWVPKPKGAKRVIAKGV